MKFGKTLLMEFRENWKGFLLFLLIVLFMVGGFIKVFPSFSETFEERLEGAENIEMDMEEIDGSIEVDLSWRRVENTESYTLLVGMSKYMIVPMVRIEGIEENYYKYSLYFENEENQPERYFAVTAVKEGVASESTRSVFVGMRTTYEGKSPFEEFLGVDYSDIRGFLTVLWSYWWFLLIGLYLGYISVTSISKDFEEERMDIIFSTTISRKQYLMEKFSALAIYSLGLLITTGLFMIGSVYLIGELNSVGPSAIFSSALFSWPIFLVIIAVSLLAAVYFEDSRRAVGFSFLFILIQYGLHTVGDMAGALEQIRPYTILTYWDHESILFDGVISMGDFGLISLLAISIIVITAVVFERKDIPM